MFLYFYWLKVLSDFWSLSTPRLAPEILSITYNGFIPDKTENMLVSNNKVYEENTVFKDITIEDKKVHVESKNKDKTGVSNSKQSGPIKSATKVGKPSGVNKPLTVGVSVKKVDQKNVIGKVGAPAKTSAPKMPGVATANKVGPGGKKTK